MVKEELDKMEKPGVITKVTQSTPWCVRLVEVPKKSVKVRICVDLKTLNKRELRETYPIPSVHETLAQLAGSRVSPRLTQI